jgi:hypothetical protein
LQAGSDPFSVESIKARPHVLIEAERFYPALRANGNQYGPSFQNVSSIWQAGDQAVARLRVPRHDGKSERHCLHPALLDAVTQLLAPFIAERGRTFVLRSIDEIAVAQLEFPAELWAHATLLPEGDADTIVGDLRVLDGSGNTCLELSRVAFTLLEPSDSAGGKPSVRLALAANSPPAARDSLILGQHFGVGVELEFAPYNQVFNSAGRRKRVPAEQRRRERHRAEPRRVGDEEQPAPMELSRKGQSMLRRRRLPNGSRSST